MITPVTSIRLFLRQLGAALSAVLVTATACSTLQAAPETTVNWQHAGWGGGGYFYCAAYHPTQDGVIYLGGDVAGVYKTTDSGRNWRFINNGIAAYRTDRSGLILVAPGIRVWTARDGPPK